MRLLKTHTLTFSLPSGEGYPGLDGIWVHPAPTTDDIEGSLQAFKKGTETLVLPDGYRTEDAKVFFTDIDIPTQNEFSAEQAATTVIKGREYTAFDKEDNTGFGLAADHYKVLLIREPQPNGDGW